MTERENVIRENLQCVRRKIERAAQKAGRSADEIKLVCVTKNFDTDDMAAAIVAGADTVGENRVQELCEKYGRVCPKEWHLIGHLQTNKVKYIIDKADLIQSVDSLRLMEEIEKQAAKKGITANILLQVNTSGEETKFGACVSDIYNLVRAAGDMEHIKVRGLMTIAPLYVKDVTNILHFDNTRKLYLDIKEKKYDNVSMDYLSMGMSGDFEEAVACGSNMVRIGSAIFGKRDYSRAL